MTPNSDADAWANLQIQFTTFSDTRATHAKSKTGTWGELVCALISPRARATKQECHLIKLATFGDQRTPARSLRSDANLLAISGIEGDYDSEQVGIDYARARLEAAGVEAFIYTTASHSPSKPRWRVLAPLSKPCPPGDRRKFVGALNAALGGVLAPESFTASQCYYFGQVTGVPYETQHARGQPIDCVSLDAVYPAREVGQGAYATIPSGAPDLDRAIALEKVTDQTIDELRSALSAIPADDRPTWVNIGQALKSLKGTAFVDEARELWLEWSETSDKYDPERDPSLWDTFGGDYSDYRAVFAEAARHGWVNPQRAKLPADEYCSLEDRTDVGNANVLIRQSDGNLRFIPERRVWLVWNGQRWELDQYGTAAQSAALGVGKHFLDKGAEVEKQAAVPGLSDEERSRLRRIAKSLAGWAHHCRNKHPLDAMLNIASRDARVQLSAERLDRDPYLFGVENGVVDLRTGQLRADARDEFVTKRSPIAYRRDALAPQWVRFIDEITGLPIAAEHDAATGEVQVDTVGRYTLRSDMVSYVKRALGYSLTGSVAEHKMFILIGDGSNGKNVLLDTVQGICGPYCHTIAPEALMATRQEADAERPSPTLAGLAGVRAAFSGESKDGQRLDVGLVKRHTGGGYMTARLMKKNTFRFAITHKLWLMTNHMPSLDHLDEALRGRLHMVRFERRWNRPAHPERNPCLPDGDKDLMNKLRAEAEGILAWLVDGAVQHFKEGLEPPGDVVRSTRDYFLEQDDLGRWLKECESCSPHVGTAAAPLFESFKQWGRERGNAAGPYTSQKAFSQALLTRGIQSKKRESGQHYGLKAPSAGAILTDDGS